MTALCTLPDAEELGAEVCVPAPPEDQLERLASAAPPMTGAEYLTAAVLHDLREELNAALRTDLSSHLIKKEWCRGWGSVRDGGPKAIDVCSKS